MKTIQWLNFSPPEMTETFGKQQFEEIFERAPSDAYIKATAEKKSENLFRAVLEVHASDMKFDIESFGANSFECIQRLCEQAKERLSYWRDHRFDMYGAAS